LKSDLAAARRALEKSKKLITVGINPNAPKSSEESRMVSKPSPAISLLKPTSSKKVKRKVHPDYLSMYDPLEKYARDNNGRGNKYLTDEEMAEEDDEGEEEVEDEKQDDLVEEIIPLEEKDDNGNTSGSVYSPIGKSGIA
jgi:hypothetical protein